MSSALEGILIDKAEFAGTDKEGASVDLLGASDMALVERAQTGGFVAFEELVRRYRNDVFRLAYHFVRNREEAWDVSQEVFIKAHHALGRFRGAASFQTWLLRITTNQCRDFLKKRRLATVSFDDAARTRPTPGLDPGAKLEAQELGDAIMTAVELLPIKQRTAFVLREFEGLSYQEMAEVMRCSLGTVMSRLHHARKKLQRHLTQSGAAEGMHHG